MKNATKARRTWTFEPPAAIERAQVVQHLLKVLRFCDQAGLCFDELVNEAEAEFVLEVDPAASDTRGRDEQEQG